MRHTLAKTISTPSSADPAMYLSILSLLPIFLSLRLVSCHASIWHPAMFGFNVTQQTFDYDNRPVVPLVHLPYSEWWFHGHLGYPPHPQDVFQLPAGGVATLQIACNKGATTYYASSEGGNIQDPNNPNDVCPGSPPAEYHTTGISDVKGCGLGIAYKDNVNDVQPADFTIFTVNHTCVWDRYTDFSVPKNMPPCPNNLCICAFFWIHSPDSGSEQMYMNGFQCTITNSTSTVGLDTPKVARRCGADPANGKPNAVPGNCTYGAKQPLYWFQAENNTMFEGTYSPPFYNDLYGFADGAQDDIFQNYYSSIPVPGPNQTELPIVSSSGSSSSASPASNGNTTTTPTSASSVNVVSPSAAPSSSSGASDGSTTPTLSALTAPVNIISASAAPSSSPNSQWLVSFCVISRRR
ncbi:hypothetical protein J3R82DRAFT_11288 [Butyriboletus roseoflavus]|nr:hypothetical protein J3R82DRAFT_11288 [Butyriboletus roseoflavus]